MVNLMQNCSQSNSIAKNTKQIARNTIRIDSVYSITSEELSLMMEIQKLQTAKLILYDWNTVVRTVVRPDDRMNEYDNSIAKLNTELANVRRNNRVNKR